MRWLLTLLWCKAYTWAWVLWHGRRFECRCGHAFRAIPPHHGYLAACPRCMAACLPERPA